MADGPFRPGSGPNMGSVVLAELARLWEQATRRLADRDKQLTQKLLASESGIPVTTVNSWSTGRSLPRTLDQLTTLSTALARLANEQPLSAREWERLLRADQAAHDVAESGGEPDSLGRLVENLTDPFALEVHRPVHVDLGGEGLPTLPPYVHRSHDDELAIVIMRSSGGQSGMAVLVGGSSTGKTRACWEAVHRLPRGWRLWHPFDPTRPDAVLAQLSQVGPQTVIWLNETQLYLDAPGETGERVAAALRSLLADPVREPVLVLGTLWPTHWDALTRDPNSNPQARALLNGTDISVPSSFTGRAMRDLARAAVGDARLALAAQEARDGEVTQYLAGVPELLARYRNAPPAARALIQAAMDARRLGHGLALSYDFLAAGAIAYFSDSEWDAADDDWLEQALAYTAAPCKGVLGPLTRIRPRPSRSAHNWATRRRSPDQPTNHPIGEMDRPVYRLADYLDQHGRRYRATEIPPPGFWAAANYANIRDQTALADAAEARGLLRDAAQLRKNASGQGDPRCAASLIASMHRLHPSDHRPAAWAVTHGDLSDPYTVAVLLDRLREAGAYEQVRALAERAARDADLSDPYTVAVLLDRLREAGAGEQVGALAERAARDADLSDPRNVAVLLDRLREAGADEQVQTLLDRDPARHADLSDSTAMADLLDRLRQAGAGEQVRALAERAARDADLSDPYTVAVLLDRLREAGAEEQVQTLLDRDPARHANHVHPQAVADLLGSLRHAGARQQVRALAERAARDADLSDPYTVADLLGSLRQAGAEEQVGALAERAARDADLGDPYTVAVLLDRLREAGAHEQVQTLADRAARDADLSNPRAVAVLLDRLREAGAHEQVQTLLDRDPARHTDLDDARAVGDLLGNLQEAGAQEQVLTLADRAARHADLSEPDAVAFLLSSLQEVGVHKQARMLADRLPGFGCFNSFQEYYGMQYRFGRDQDGEPSARWTWDDLDVFP